MADLPATTLSYNLIVPLYARAKAQYLLSSCNAGGCTDGQVLLIDGNAVLNHLVKNIGYLKASNTGAADEFGLSVSLNRDGTVLAVGAPFEDGAEDQLNGSGAVYLFSRDAQGNWQALEPIRTSDAQEGDNFGSSLSLNDAGNVLAVGARRKNSDIGAVYIFSQEDGGSWTEQTSVTGSDSFGFGASVSLNKEGTVLAVGDDGSGEVLGHAYIFVRKNGPANWPQQDMLSASNGENGDLFGSSISLSDDGTVVAVGAPSEDSDDIGVTDTEAGTGVLSNSGAVYLFGKVGDKWPQQAYIKASNTGARDNFGASVSLNQDGTVLAVGASREDNSATGVPADSPTPITDKNDAFNAGAVYLFGRESKEETWAQQAYIKASNTGPNNAFGTSVSLSADGQRLAVGADTEDNKATGLNSNDSDNNEAGDSGAAYSYVYRDGSWQFESYLKASNTGADDRFGTVLSLSGDGQTLAVGARFEDSNGKGVGGYDGADPEALDYDPLTNDSIERSGAVYLY